MAKTTRQLLLQRLQAEAETSLDSTTQTAFEQLRKRGFEPFLVRGESEATQVYCLSGDGYTAVLVAPSRIIPKERSQKGRLVDEFERIIPVYNNDLPIRQINLFDSSGLFVVRASYPSREEHPR